MCTFNQAFWKSIFPLHLICFVFCCIHCSFPSCCTLSACNCSSCYNLSLISSSALLCSDTKWVLFLDLHAENVIYVKESWKFYNSVDKFDSSSVTCHAFSVCVCACGGGGRGDGAGEIGWLHKEMLVPMNLKINAKELSWLRDSKWWEHPGSNTQSHQRGGEKGKKKNEDSKKKSHQRSFRWSFTLAACSPCSCI